MAYKIPHLQSDLMTNAKIGERRLKVQSSSSELGYDAWGKPKSITDFSVWHGMFTFEVPSEMWLEFNNGVESDNGFTQCTSENGALAVNGVAGETHYLISKRHPRYQPNRGHLYSSSMILPDNANGSTYEFGMFHDTAGVFFRVQSGVLYAVRRTMVDGVVTDYATECPCNTDLAKGNIYDIQIQWRGVGNMKFFVNQNQVQELSLLGTLDSLSVYNPALPIRFQVEGAGKMFCGCVDVTSEGGFKESRIRGSINSSEQSLSTTEVPIAAIQLPRRLNYNGDDILNTRDVALRRVSGYADESAKLRVHYTRKEGKFAGTTWTNYDQIGALRYAINGDIVVDNTTVDMEDIAERRVPRLDSIEIDNPDPERGDYYLVGGDIILVTLQAKNNTLGGCGIEWGSEI